MSDRDQLRDQVFLGVAHDVARLATCDRLHVGAVIVNRARKIVSTGYNGAPSGYPHCDEIGHRLINDRCLRAVHAEANAIQQAQEDGRVARGATIYCTHFPCPDCARDIIRADLARVVYANEFLGGDTAAVLEMFRQAGIAAYYVPIEEGVHA